jgi:hypothetical protein
VIEITFKGEDYATVFREMDEFLDWSWAADKRLPAKLDPMQKAEPPAKAEEPAKPEEKPKPKPKSKPDAAERMAKVRAAKEAKKRLPEPPPSDPRSSDEAALEAENAKIETMEPDPFDEPAPEAFDPAKLAALRLRTTEDLQAAYSGGKHKQVMALLSKYGNGARSFRELQIQDFVPIRKAIDDGALA